MCISLSYDRAEMRLQRVCPSTRPFDVEQSGRHHIKCHQIIFDYIQNSVDNSSSSTQYCCWWIKRMAHVCSSVAVVFSTGLLLIIHWRPRYFIVRDSFDCLHYTQTDRMRRDCLDFLCILDYCLIWFNLRVLRIIVFSYGICVMRGREEVCVDMSLATVFHYTRPAETPSWKYEKIYAFYTSVVPKDKRTKVYKRRRIFVQLVSFLLFKIVRVTFGCGSCWKLSKTMTIIRHWRLTTQNTHQRRNIYRKHTYTSFVRDISEERQTTQAPLWKRSRHLTLR